MLELTFEVTGATAEPYAVVPTISLELRVTESTGAKIGAVALRAQIRIEPQRRRYGADEEMRLFELFGTTGQWGESLRPFLWTEVATTIGMFTGETTVSLPITCTYDLEVSGAKYFHALSDGVVPLVVLFNGSVFSAHDGAMSVEPLPWHLEARYRLPATLWRETMDRYFPDGGWLRLSRQSLDALQRVKNRLAMPTWDGTVEMLLKEAGESE